MNAPLAFLDTETTSLALDRQAWDIAIIRREPDGNETWWESYVDVSTADPMSLRIGRFYERHPYGRWILHGEAPGDWPYPGQVGDFLTQQSAARKVAQLTHGAYIVGAVPSFDTYTLENLLRSAGLTPSWHHRLRCVETLVAGHCKREVGGLGKCAEALGIEFDLEQAHTAMGDAQLVMRVWDAVMSISAPTFNPAESS